MVSAGLCRFHFLCGFVLVSACLCQFHCFVLVLCWSLSWSLLVSLFCDGFVLVSAALCWFHCFVLVLCWSLLVSAGFAVLCWFCAGLRWSLPVSLFCAGFVLVSASLCWFRYIFCAGFVLVALPVSAGFAVLCCFCAGLCWSLLVLLFLCWFCGGLCWSLPVSPFCAGFVMEAEFKTFLLFTLILPDFLRFQRFCWIFEKEPLDTINFHHMSTCESHSYIFLI